MKFPIKHCVLTSGLTKDTYEQLLAKLKLQGYHWNSMLDKSGFFDMLSYIGVNRYGDIMLYDNNSFYLDIDEESEENILSKEWLGQYLAN